MYLKLSSLTKLLTAIVVGFGLFTVSTSAAISISPYNSNNLNPKEKNWFLFEAKPGQTLEDSFAITNSENSPATLKISTKDFDITTEGGYTIVADEVENKETGNWFKLDISRAVVGANSQTRIPFSLTVPAATKDGEYSAGLATTEISQTQEAVSIALRKGIRSYIAVGSDFNLSAEVVDLNIVDPSDENFENILKTKAYAGRDNLLIGVKIKNTGNIFGVVNAKYSLKYDDGSVFEGTFGVDIAPGAGSRDYYVVTNKPYKTGKTEAIFDYQLSPQNIDSAKVKLSNSKGVLSDNLNLTQSQLDNFSKSKQSFYSSSSVEESKTKENKNPTLLQNLIYIVLPIIVFVGVVGGVIIAEREVWLENNKKVKTKK